MAYFDEALPVIDNFYQTQPYIAAFLTCSVKASAADLLAQSRQLGQGLLSSTTSSRNEVQAAPQQPPVLAQPVVFTPKYDQALMESSDANDGLDLQRNLGFICYGGIYQGLAQQYLFTTFYPNCFPGLSGWTSVFAQVALDMSVVGPLICLPLAYVVKAFFTGAGLASSGAAPPHLLPCRKLSLKDTQGLEQFVSDIATFSLASVTAGLDKYRKDVLNESLLLKYWALWIPVQLLTFGVIPPHYRVLFVAMFSFVWVIILSTIAASTPKPEQQSVSA
jgi:protein Mpv17